MINANQPLSKSSQIWGLVLMFSAIVLSPFYFYVSGLPQPGHIVMLAASIALIGLNATQCLALVKQNKVGALFVLLVLFVNLVYALLYQDKSFLVSFVYWLYGFVLLVAAMAVAQDQKVAMWVSRFILFKFALVVVLYLLGWGGYTWWPRYNYFFNGPNQLAYFAICLLLVFVAATRAKWSASFYAAYALTIFIVISTGGRSAYLAMLPLVGLLLWMARRQLLNGLLLLVLPLALNLVFEPLCLPLYKPAQQGNEFSGCTTFGGDDIKSVSELTLDRIYTLSLEPQALENKSVLVQLSARGYIRAVDHPQYLLFGAGQGMDERFGDIDGHVYEIHSSILAVLFYYGIGGLTLFTMFIWRIFNIKINILFLAPLFVYGLFTYGLRSPYFWVALAFLSTAPNLFQLTKNSISNYRN